MSKKHPRLPAGKTAERRDKDGNLLATTETRNGDSVWSVLCRLA